MNRSSVLVLSLLFALLLVMPAAGKDAAAKCRISFEAGTEDKIILQAGDRQNGEILGENTGSGSFDLTYTEPGVYEYTVSNGRKSYALEVHVLYEKDTMTAIPVIYGESGQKTDIIRFSESIPKTSGSMFPVSPVQTGDTNSVYFWWITAAVSLLLITVSFLVLYRRKQICVQER